MGGRSPLYIAGKLRHMTKYVTGGKAPMGVSHKKVRQLTEAVLILWVQKRTFSH